MELFSIRAGVDGLRGGILVDVKFLRIFFLSFNNLYFFKVRLGYIDALSNFFLLFEIGLNRLFQLLFIPD